MAADRVRAGNAKRDESASAGSAGGRLLVAVVAAGASRRLGQAKQLVCLDGEPLLRRQCRIAIAAEIGHVAVVLGCRAEECAEAIKDLPVEQLTNENWQHGLGGSIAVAARAASAAGAAGLLMMHVDQFRLSVADLSLLHQAWQAAGGDCVCVATHGEYAGPPVIFPNAKFDDLQLLDGDTGARQLIASLPRERLRQVKIRSAPDDLDLPGDLRAIAAGGNDQS